MTREDLEKILTPKEYALVVGLQEGKTLRQIAAESRSTYGSVRTLKYQLKKRFGESNFDNIIGNGDRFFDNLAQYRDPGLSLPFFKVDYLQDKLSAMEFEVFMLIKMGERRHNQIAKIVGSKTDAVIKSVNRIKEKLNGYYDTLIAPETFIEGIETYYDVIKKRVIDKEPAAQNQESNSCFDCIHYKGSIFFKGKAKIYCNGFSRVYFEEGSHCRCESYSRYIPAHKEQERDLLEERLQDKGFLEMAYNLAQGYEPTDPIEKTQYAIAYLGFRSYHFNRKRQHRTLMEKAARYAVVAVSSMDRKRPEVKQVIKHLKLSPTKIDFELNEDGDHYTIAHYVLKDQKSFKALSGVLIGDVKISLPEQETIKIDFQRKTTLSSLHVLTEQGEKEKLDLDYQDDTPRFEHTARFPASPGKYILTVTPGKKADKDKNSRSSQPRTNRWGTILNYEIDVVEDKEGLQIDRCRPLFG
ncbi:MAG: hypothetical protein AVO34_05250 [Firmicutes bacterium ML8_F2]|nr:MAG: hypothetical protein AVO34_05250 [Firmicutes bacterium ML8_F2]